MLSHASKTLAILLLIANFAFATAPEWIVKGVELEYKVGSDTVVFSVVERNSTEIEIDIKTGPKIQRATENASAITGQFWFDPALLEDASKYHHIEDEYEVVDIKSKTIAGTEWEAVSLETMLSGAKTTKVYDRETGLMLSQTVLAEGAPAVTLKSYSLEPGTPPVEVPEEEVEEQTTEPEEEVQNEPAAEQEPEVTTAEDNEPEATVISPGPEPSAEAPQEEEQPKKKPCCPSSLILPALIGLVLIRR